MNGNVNVPGVSAADLAKVEAKIPALTTDDDGKFIKVQNGKMVAVAIDIAEEATFGNV